MGSPPKIPKFEWLEPEGTPPEEIMKFLPEWIKKEKPWKKPQCEWKFSPRK